MYMRIGDVVIGVVNDYDLSVLNTDQRDLGKERTGTIPFMAGKLLQMMNSTLKLPHLYGAFPGPTCSSLTKDQ